MSESRLEIAKQLIRQKEYSGAKKVLEAIPEHPTAKAWLKRLQEIESQSAENFPEPITLPPRVEVIVRKYLARDEFVLWYEQPEPNIFVQYINPTWTVVLSIITSLGLLIFLFYLQFSVIRRGGISPSFYIQIATPVILMFTPFIRIQKAKNLANNVHYVITNQQGFIIENLKVKELSLKDVKGMEISQEKAGFTSLIFHRYSDWWNLITIRVPVGFLGIAKANEVKQLISKYWRSR